MDAATVWNIATISVTIVPAVGFAGFALGLVTKRVWCGQELDKPVGYYRR